MSPQVPVINLFDSNDFISLPGRTHKGRERTVNYRLQNNSVTSYFRASPYHSEQLPPRLVKLHFVTEHGSPSNHRNVFSSDINTILKTAVSRAVALYFFVPQEASFNKFSILSLDATA